MRQRLWPSSALRARAGVELSTETLGERRSSAESEVGAGDGTPAFCSSRLACCAR